MLSVDSLTHYVSFSVIYTFLTVNYMSFANFTMYIKCEYSCF